MRLVIKLLLICLIKLRLFEQSTQVLKSVEIEYVVHLLNLVNILSSKAELALTVIESKVLGII